MLQPFTFFPKVHEGFLPLFYQRSERCSVVFPLVPYVFPKIFLAVSSWTPQMLLRAESLLPHAKRVALTSPVNPTCSQDLCGVIRPITR